MKKCILRWFTSVSFFALLTIGILVSNPTTASAYTNPSKYNTATKAVIQYCYTFLVTEMDMTPAMACGVLANIDIESDFDPTCLPSSGRYYGLFQLGDDRLERMKSYCTSIGVSYTTEQGQLRYIAAEHTLTTYEKSQYQKFLNVTSKYGNDAEGAYYAGYAWAQYIERCANTSYSGYAVRGNYAKNDFWPLYGADAISLNDCTVELSGTSYTYAGSAIKPTVTVTTSDGVKLTQGTNYTVTYSGNNTIGTAMVTIEGTGHVTGTVTKTFTIAMDVAHVNTISNTASAVQITWRKVPGATHYRVFRKTSGTSWTALSRATASSYGANSSGDLVYNDATAVAGTSYTYIVRAFFNSTGYTYDATGKNIVRLTVPELQTPTINTKGILVKWNAVTGASSYRIYRKTSSTSYSMVGTATGTSWTDTNVTSNTSYIYTVRAIATGSISSFKAAGVTLRFVGTPQLEELANYDSGIKFSWKAVTGATKYRVYRRLKGSSGWTRLGDVSSSKLYWLDTTASAGKDYEYTARAAIGSTFSSYDTKGVAGTRLATPALVSIANNNPGIAVRWQQVAGAEQYYIYRYANDTRSWARIHTADASVYAWTDTTAENGTKYTYTVRAVSSSSGTTIRSSFVSAGITMYRITPTVLSSVTSASSQSMTVLWNTNSTASGYLIQYATDASFTSPVTVNVKSQTTSSYTFSKLTKGKTLYVRVRAYKTVNSKNYYSYWSKTNSVTIN